MTKCQCLVHMLTVKGKSLLEPNWTIMFSPRGEKEKTETKRKRKLEQNDNNTDGENVLRMMCGWKRKVLKSKTSCTQHSWRGTFKQDNQFITNPLKKQTNQVDPVSDHKENYWRNGEGTCIARLCLLHRQSKNCSSLSSIGWRWDVMFRHKGALLKQIYR